MFVHQIHDRGLSIPGRAMPGVIKFLGSALPEADTTALEEMQKLIVESLKTNESDDADEAISSQLENLVPKIKSACGV